MRALAALAAPAVLAACGGLFQTHETAPVVYTLHAAPPAAAPATVAATLVIARPVARPGLDSERIAVRLPDRRLDAYAGASWSAPPPRLVEALLLDAFRGAGGWRAVVSEQSAFPGRYLLQTEVTDFAAEYADGGGAPLVRVALRGELGLGAERRLVASVAGAGEVRAAADRQREVAAAFEAAAARAVAELVAAADAAALAAEAPPP
ncbi:MAG TPA: ABC-type transport auxiliary lipoprotein family protein [Steroidobacteraceae bacterium]|nr:ABC-type transport auxiliary lipoprotein family protein [Steroidobacteraceae bacterium]